MEDYIAIKIGRIFPDYKLSTDIYLKINGKYIKYKESGDIIESSKYDYFIHKNLKEIFITKDQLELFEQWAITQREEEINQLVHTVGEEHRDLAEKRENLREDLIDSFTEEELNEEDVKEIQSKVQEFIKEVSEKKTPQVVIAKLTKNNESIAEHSVNVANIALFISMTLGYENKTILRNIYMGAIFHDYGKAKIPERILENKLHPMYSEALFGHPKKAVAIIEKSKSIPKQVLTMVHQHHEMYNGKGYPDGLQENEISEYAKIISIANEFDNAIPKFNLPIEELYKNPIKLLEYDKGKKFDPELIKRLIGPFKMAFNQAN